MLVVYCIFCICVLVLLVIYLFRREILPFQRINAAKKSPEIRTHAVLINKTQKIIKVGYGSSSDLYLVFEFPDGTRKDFLVDNSTYNTLMKGEEGILTYHELGSTRALVSFQRTKY